LFRVKTVRKADHVLSVLSIKSAIPEDSGNYTCTETISDRSDTVKVSIVDGKQHTYIL
jgi:hypothetical protein